MFRGNEANTDPRGQESQENPDRPDQRSDPILSWSRPSRFPGSFFLLLICRSSQGSEGEAGTPGPKGSKVSPVFSSSFVPSRFPA